MEILGEFFEKDIDSSQAEEKEIAYKLRKAARAVLFNRDNQIAVMFVSKENYHKLPGGGVEKEEDLESALRREIMEETGCSIKVRHSVGAIIEYRDSHELLQISYCYMADVEGDPGVTLFTKKEIEEGFRLEWQYLDDAIETLEKDDPADYSGKFIRQRDLLFLKKAKEIISKDK